MYRYILFILTCFLLNSWEIKAQEQTILLNVPTTHDYLSMGIKSFHDKPELSPITAQIIEQEELILPQDTSNSYFFSVFVDHKENSQVAVMVTPAEDGEQLHIDLNNDNDLTNDGGPYFFPKHNNAFPFFVTHPDDSLQKAGRLLLRYPKAVASDSAKLQEFIDEYFDQDGNLNQYWTNYWRRHNPDFEGKKGTFYYTDRLDIRRGKLKVGKTSYLIGINDWKANGRYDDQRDRLFVDLNQDKKLTPRDTREIFKPTDTFTVEHKTFQLSHIDPYGRSLTVNQVAKQDDSFYISFSDSVQLNIASDTHFPAVLAQTFWEKEFETLGKNTLNMSSLKGRFILLNFWGEWCAPCYREIPLLAKANKHYSDEKLKIVSFLKAMNLSIAQEVILEHEMNWPQILLNMDTEQRLRISGYPANILIFPDGKTSVISGGIEEGYFENYIK